PLHCSRTWRASCERTRFQYWSHETEDFSRMVRSAAAKSLLELIRSRKAKTGVIGLGYVGLPLAVEFGRAGYEAIGFDLDARKVNAITEGRSYIDDVPTAHVAELKAANRLRATTNLDALA